MNIPDGAVHWIVAGPASGIFMVAVATALLPTFTPYGAAMIPVTFGQSVEGVVTLMTTLPPSLEAPVSVTPASPHATTGGLSLPQCIAHAMPRSPAQRDTRPNAITLNLALQRTCTVLTLARARQDVL